MTLFSKKKFIGSFLSLLLLCGTGALTLNSCAKDADEPYWPDDTTQMDPSDTENPDEENNGDDNSGDDTPGDDNPGDETPGDDNTGDDNTGDVTGDGDIDPNYDLPDAFMGDYAYGYVEVPSGVAQQYKEYTSYILSFNKDTKTPNYVSWELLSSELNGSAKRDDYDFWQDKDLEGCPTKDYQYNTYKYQRGHMCPAADNTWSADAMRDCFSMANMAPQYASLNEKIWGTLENNCRTWARKLGSLWIICGPLYADSDDKRIGASGVLVPSSYFKALLYYDGKDSKAIGFIFRNGANNGNLYDDFSMSIDDLEEQTGYDFFPALPDDIENAVEAEHDPSFWINKL
ncbi:MAG: DNA/RNA non-specific endonuclease [Muribaculaceae bacterium]|nr:DNA/RNA non-specific endonuclease [Muribaculaceae bacterium]